MVYGDDAAAGEGSGDDALATGRDYGAAIGIWQ